MTAAALAVGYLCGLVLVCMLMWILVALHMAYTRIDRILECFKNSSSVLTLASLREGGAWGNLLLIGGVSGLVTFSGFYVKRGGVSIDDVKRVPKSLKRDLVVLHCSVLVLIAALVVFVATYKLIVALEI